MDAGALTSLPVCMKLICWALECTETSLICWIGRKTLMAGSAKSLGWGLHGVAEVLRRREG